MGMIIKIKNCNCISDADIYLEENSLNIKHTILKQSASPRLLPSHIFQASEDTIQLVLYPVVQILQLNYEKKMSVDMFYRDPYMLDFLGLKDTYSEKDLENAILAQLEKFILEMGSDFAFLARQKHFVLHL